MKLKKKSIKKRAQKNYSGQPGLTYKTRDPSHKMGITS